MEFRACVAVGAAFPRDELHAEFDSRRRRVAGAMRIVKATGRGWGAVQWHLYVLEREGRVKSVRIGPFIYYFVNPKAAAEVILASVTPDSLSLEDREKLDLLASGA